MGIILTDDEMQVDWTNDEGETTDKLEISKSDLLFMLRLVSLGITLRRFRQGFIQVYHSVCTGVYNIHDSKVCGYICRVEIGGKHFGIWLFFGLVLLLLHSIYAFGSIMDLLGTTMKSYAKIYPMVC